MDAPAWPTAAFVLNHACIRDPRQVSARCRDAAKASGWRPLLLETTTDDAGTGPACRALAAGASLVFAVGGDGTVRACAQALAGTTVPLAIVPQGTANLAARALGVPPGLDAALAAGFSGPQRRIDLAVAEGITFAAMAGLGVDAAVVAATPARFKARAGWLAYAATGARHATGRRAVFSVSLDGAKPFTRRARSVVVGNAGLLPGGFVLLPAAQLDDGELDVGILAPASPFGWARVAYRVLAASRHADRLLERHRARRVEIRADRELPREVDGEVIAPGRVLTVTVTPAALLVRALPVGCLPAPMVPVTKPRVWPRGREPVPRSVWDGHMSSTVTTLAAAGSRPAFLLAAGRAGAGPHAVHVPGLAVATLVAWLIAGAAGLLMLRAWLAHGGPHHQRSRKDGLHPAVIFTHFGLGAIGLGVWIGYLLTGLDALAWSAVGVLMPGIGFGLCTVILSTPYPTPQGMGTPMPGGGTSPGAARSATGMLATPAEDAMAGQVSNETLAKTLSNEVLTSRLINEMIAGLPQQPEPERSSRRHLAPLIPAGHGLAAMATFGLAVVTAILAR